MKAIVTGNPGSDLALASLAQKVASRIPTQWKIGHSSVRIEATACPLEEHPPLEKYRPELESHAPQTPHTIAPVFEKQPIVYLHHPRYPFISPEERLALQYELLSTIGLLFWNKMPELRKAVQEKARYVYDILPSQKGIRRIFFTSFADYFRPVQIDPAGAIIEREKDEKGLALVAYANAWMSQNYSAHAA